MLRLLRQAVHVVVLLDRLSEVAPGLLVLSVGRLLVRNSFLLVGLGYSEVLRGLVFVCFGLLSYVLKILPGILLLDLCPHCLHAILTERFDTLRDLLRKRIDLLRIGRAWGSFCFRAFCFGSVLGH